MSITIEDLLKKHGLDASVASSPVSSVTATSPSPSSKPAATSTPASKPIESGSAQEEKPTFWERIKNIGKAGGLQTGGSYVAAGATAADVAAESRSKTLSEAQSVTLGNYEKELEKELGIINAYENNTTYNGQTFTKEEYEDALDMAKNLQFYVDAMSPAYEQAQAASREFGGKAQEEATSIINKGAAAQEEAKQDLGSVGSFLVDASVAGVQMAGDALVGVATGGGAAGAMLVRSFGSGANSAAQSGGDTKAQLYEGIKSASLEYISEKLFGGNPIYDDGGIVTNQLFKIADKLGKSDFLTKALSSLPAKMLGEGLEEMSVGILDPLVNRLANWIDGGARETDMPDWNDLLREGAIGALLGGAANVLTGNVGKRSTQQTEAQAEQSAEMTAEAETEQTAQEAAESAEALPPESYSPEVQTIVKQAIDGPTAQPDTVPVTFDAVAALAGVQNTRQTATQTVSQEAQTAPEQAAQTTEQQAAFDPVSYMASQASQTQETESAQAQETVVTPDMAQIVQDAILNRSPASNVRSSIAAVLSNNPIPAPTTSGEVSTQESYHQPPVTAPGPYIPIGENASRSVAVPVENQAGKPTSRFYRTALEAGTTTPEFAKTLEEGFEEGLGSYTATTNADQQRRAVERIRSVGFDAAVNEVLDAAEKASTQADTAVQSMLLMKAAQDSGDMETASKLFIATKELITAGAQTTQAASVYKELNDNLEYYEDNLTGEQRLYLMQKVVDQYNEHIRTNNLFTEKQRQTTITIPKALSDALLNAKTPDAAQAAVDSIRRDVYQQAPISWREGWNRIRYFTMMFNPRTHIKNMVGNAVAVPLRGVSSLLSTGIQTAVRAADKKGQFSSTRAFLNPFSAADRALLSEGFNRSAAALAGTPGKYNDYGFGASGEFSISDIERNKTFRGKFGALTENVTGFASGLLQKEDLFFSRRAYAIAFARDCKANGVTALQIENLRSDPRVTNAAALRRTLGAIDKRSMEVAKHTTYQEARMVTDLFARGGVYKPSDDMATRLARDAYNALAPFKSTPTNMAAQVVEYSPAGLIKSVSDLCFNVRKGKISAAKAIDNFCSGFTGSILFGIGALLVRQGVLTLHGTDDEKQDKFNELQGWQAYSLHIGDTYYSINDLGAVSIPLFIGGEVYSAIENGDDRTFGEKLESIANITTPIFETSMLSAVTDIFEEMQYNEPSNWLSVVIGSCAKNVVSQLVVSLGGAIERTFFEDRVNSTFIDRTGSGGTLSIGKKEIDTPFLADKPNLQYAAGTILNKIPGVEYNQIPRIDEWGREESTGNFVERAFANFISPGYISHETPSGEVEEELQRLYDTGLDGSTTMFPTKASQSTKVNGNYLTADEYVTYQKTLGETSLENLSAIMSSSAWDGYNKAEQIDIVNKVYSYARAMAQLEVDNNTSVDSWISESTETRRNYGMTIPEYIAAEALYGHTFLDNDTTKAVVNAGADMDAFFKAKERISDLPKTPDHPTSVLGWQKMIYISGQDFPDAAKEAYYEATMNSDNTYDDWLAAKANGKTMQEFCAGHYDSYISGILYTGGVSSPAPGSSDSSPLSDLLAKYGLS